MKHIFRVHWRDDEVGVYTATDAAAQIVVERIADSSGSATRFIGLARDGSSEIHFINLAEVSLITYSIEEDPA